MHRLLGGLCAALLFLAGLPQIGHTADPIPLKTAWLGEHEAFAAWYAKQKGWDLEEGFRLEMLSYDSGKQLMAGMGTAHWEIAACGAIPALTASLDNQAEIIAIGNDESLSTGIYTRKDSPILGHTGYNALYPEMAGTGGTVRGKTILCTTGSAAHYTVHKWLKSPQPDGRGRCHQGHAAPRRLEIVPERRGRRCGLWSPYTLEAEQHGLAPITLSSQCDASQPTLLLRQQGDSPRSTPISLPPSSRCISAASRPFRKRRANSSYKTTGRSIMHGRAGTCPRRLPRGNWRNTPSTAWKGSSCSLIPPRRSCTHGFRSWPPSLGARTGSVNVTDIYLKKLVQ